jgi:hypothetical protein
MLPELTFTSVRLRSSRNRGMRLGSDSRKHPCLRRYGRRLIGRSPLAEDRRRQVGAVQSDLTASFYQTPFSHKPPFCRRTTNFERRLDMSSHSANAAPAQIIYVLLL